MSTMSAPKFFVTLLHAATQVHLLHLKTRSYAAHKALEGLYDELPDLADKLIETYQGINGLVTDYPALTIQPPKDDLGFVEALCDFVKKERGCVGKESQLQNIVDEIQALIDGTVYKLKFLS